MESLLKESPAGLVQRLIGKTKRRVILATILVW